MSVEIEGLLRPYWPTPDHLIHLMVSGGADSMALLALTAEFSKRMPRNILVHHCHHGVESNADMWCDFVQSETSRYGFEFRRHDLRLNSGPGFEARARNARYQALLHHAEAGDIVMTAHHRDDQIETLMIRLSQGSGLIGLAGIPNSRKLGSARLVRPLLKLTRLQLRQVLSAHNLNFVVDSSNHDPIYLRNFTRLKLLPALTSVSPKVKQRLLQLSELATARVSRIGRSLGDRMPTTEVSVIKLADTNKLVGWQIRFFAQSRDQFAPSSAQIQEFARQCIESSTDRVPELSLSSSAVLRRWRGYLHWIDNPAQFDFDVPSVNREVHLDPNSHMVVDLSCGRLTLSTAATPADLHIWEGATGLRFRIGRNRSKQTLKRIAQVFGIAPWLRKITPLITEDEFLLGWGGVDCRNPEKKLPSLKWEWQFIPMHKDDISVS